MSRIHSAGKMQDQDTPKFGAHFCNKLIKRDEAERSMKGARLTSGMKALMRITVVAVMTMVFGLTGFIERADAAVGILEDFSTAEITNTTTSGATTNYTPPAGSNRLMVLVVQIHTNNTTATTMTMTYGDGAGGAAEITATPVVNTDSAQRRQVWIATLDESQIAASPGNVVTVTTNNPGSGYILHIATYDGVDQGTPVADTGNIYSGTTTVNNYTWGTALNVGAGGYGIAASVASTTLTSLGASESYAQYGQTTVGSAYAGLSDKAFASAGTTLPILISSANGYSGMAGITLNQQSCIDLDPAALVLDCPAAGGETFVGPGTITAQVTGEANPEDMTNMQVTIAGTSACDVTAAAMTWNVASGLWEYEWDTAACGTVTPETGFTVDVSGTDPDCGTDVSAPQNANSTIDNTCNEFSPSKIVWNGTNTAAGNFNGASFVTAQDVGGLQYKVTEGSGPGTVALMAGTPNWNEVTGTISSITTTNYTVPAGTDRMLIVYAFYETGTAPSVDLANTTYNGTSLSTIQQGLNGRDGVWAGYLSLGTSASPTTADLVVTTTATTDDQAIWAAVYENVDQSTVPAAQFTSGTVSALSVDIANIEGGKVLYGYHGNGVGTGNDVSVPTADTWTEHVDSDVGGGFQVGLGERNETTAGTVTVDVASTADTGRDELLAISFGPSGGGETTLIDWVGDPIPGMANLTNGNTYNLYARGIDLECGINTYYGEAAPGVGETVADGTAQSFTWIACVEDKTLALDTIPATITGNTTIQVTTLSDAGAMLVGDTDPPTHTSPWSYVPPQDDNTSSVTFYAQGSGTCGTLTDSFTANISTMAAPTVDSFTIPDPVVDTAAPLEIPISTFSASDNVGVTGYMITESSTAPLDSDPNWVFPAPTTYGVSSYGPYTLYAWAKDAAGNVSAYATASTTVTNCTPAITALTISASPNPVNSPTARNSTITLTPAGDTVSSTAWTSSDGQSGASGDIYTAPAQSVGNVSISGNATETTCSTIFDATNQPYFLNFDTRTPYIVAGSASVAQSGINQVVVTMPYLGINDGSATFKIEYSVNGGGTVTIGPEGDVGNVSPYEKTFGAFAEGDQIDVTVTYADSRWSGAGYTESNAVQVLSQVTILTWADSPMLHNSNRFACSVTGYFTNAADCVTAGGVWTTDRKWTVTGDGPEWGTSDANDVYGPIMCSTCHEKEPANANIKRIRSQISASRNTFPGQSAEVVADNAATSYGADNSVHVSPAQTKVCETCHSKNSVHNYSMAAAASHNGNNCLECHEHKVGFRASCAACHGNPPETGKLVTKSSTGPLTTGSTTAGAHLAHVTTQGIKCALCHYGSVGSGSKHNTTGVVTLSFTNLPTGTGGVTGGSYDGQTAVTYDTTDLVNTTLTNTGTKTCANYCHGDTLAGASPVWDGSVACGSCHAITAATVSALPSGSSHAAHVSQGKDCSFCHGAGYTNATGAEAAPAGHVDGSVVYDVTAIGGAATYRAAATGSTGATAPSATYGNCANTTCHGGATPTWNDASTAQCGSCHGTVGAYGDARDGAPPNDLAGGSNPDKVGKHANHLGLSFSLTGNYCSLCHDGAGSGTANHADGGVDFAFAAAAGGSATYTPGSPPSCSSLDANNCHAGTASWDPAATIACTACHTGSGPGAKAVGSASSHTLVTTGGAFGDCTDCHTGHFAVAGGVNIANNNTVGINYGHGGIKLGGPGTATNINGVSTADLDTQTSEAEICWTCHDAQTVKISEWGVNSQSSTGSSPYNYGNLTPTSNWTTATWSSSRSQFAYKSGAIQSTHSANDAPTYPLGTLSGANYGKTETPDDVRDIRCSYCHDVHELAAATGDSAAGKPYLRGTWMGNPYEEDGAPRSGYANTTYFQQVGAINWGAVPRGSVLQRRIGGYWIDQNNVRPMSAGTATDGTAALNPTSGWAGPDVFAGLCALCHGGGNASWTATEIDNIDEVPGEALWMGTNGHANSVKGGTGAPSANSTNIFDARGGIAAGTTAASLQLNTPRQHYVGSTAPGDNTSGVGFRSTNSNALRYTPALVPGNTRPYGYNTDEWVVDESGATKENQYHKFSCSKCHNPHASRLPKLMITNCLDTVHNTWDNQFQMVTASSTLNNNREIAQWTSAQNCHRYSESNNTNTTSPEYRANRLASPGGSGAGWNKVTPWMQTTSTP